jgi:hypothetical protein
MKQIGLALPAETRNLDPAAAVTLVEELTDRAISGEFEPVAELTRPEFPATPDYLRRELDGRSVYTRPGAVRYATHVQLSLEERLLQAAQRQAAPHLSREEAARLLGAEPDALEAQLRKPPERNHPMSRYALALRGYDDASVWGYDSQMETYYAQLWRNESDSWNDPDIWLSGLRPIPAAPALAEMISARTGVGTADVMRAMAAAKTAPESEELATLARQAASAPH